MAKPTPATPIVNSRTAALTLVALTVIIVWLACLTAYVAVLNAQLRSAAYANGQTSINQTIALNKLRFCYSYGLKPCDDVSISDFNRTVPKDRQFDLTQPRF